MYRVYKSLKESFDKSYEVKPTPEGKVTFNIPGVSKYYFKTEDDTFYVIFYSKNLATMGGQWNNFYSNSLNRKFTLYAIDFLRVINPNIPWDFSNFSQDKKYTKNFISVFSTVIKHSIELLKDKEFDLITLSGKQSENRGRIYNKMAKKFASVEDATVLGLKPIYYMGDNFESSVIMPNSVYNSLDASSLNNFLEEFNIHSN